MDIKEYEQLLNEVENKLDRLKALYEQWFQGVERLEPQVPRKDLERRMQILFKEKPRNTALRFRYQMLIQRWTTYLTYWQRVGRQIEEGTYRRDMLKARQRREERRARRGQPLDVDVEVEVEDIAEEELTGEIPVQRPARPGPAPLAPIAPIAPISELTPLGPGGGSAAAPAARRPLSTFGLPGGAMPKTPHPSAPQAPIPPPVVSTRPPTPSPVAARAPATPAPVPVPATATFGKPRDLPRTTPMTGSQTVQALADQDLRRIHQQYVDARKRNNEPAEVKFETLAKSIRDMEPRLREKYAGKKIDFEVVVQNGKVGLKPVPR
jgi:hypothetical protein